MRKRVFPAAISAFALTLSACGGDGGGGSPSPGATPAPSPTPTTVYAVPAQEALTIAEVQRIIAQAVAEARARNRPSVIVVTDRVGNVLANYRMVGAPQEARSSPTPSGRSLEVAGLNFPAEGGAIAKAITGAYLSSGGNAFSSRTASQIVQEHFPPAPGLTNGLESGPLFGVQFSSLPCSDLAERFDSNRGANRLIGPKRSPLGLSADAGGFPLYKNGVLVGGIGVQGDGVYDFDPEIRDLEDNDEEHIALAGTIGFDAPEEIRAPRIAIDGATLRYSDATPQTLRSNPAAAPPFSSLTGAIGALGLVRDYATIQIVAGVAYGTEASGIRASTPAEFSNRDAFILTDGFGANRYPIRAGTDAASVATPITAVEARAVLEEAFIIMSRARAAIRRPLDSRAQVSISVVDTHGEVLGLVRSPDAPIFGVDVSLQKARSVAFFSNAIAAQQLMSTTSIEVPQYVQRMRDFLGDPAALTGNFAYSNRAIGNLARPFFPDGEVARPNGPLSRAITDFNPFSTGLQTSLIIDNVREHLAFLRVQSPFDTPRRCTKLPDSRPGLNRLANGLQIFPGGMPIYRGTQLIGAIGISGDGIDQDDMISFLGLYNAGLRVGSIGLPAPDRRSDRIEVDVGPDDTRLRFFNCPIAPFLDTNAQNVCQGI